MKLLHNARIHTLDPQRPVASVLALENERIAAVGDEDLLSEFEAASREDMQGRVILPGLTDAHIHLKELALSRQILDCEGDPKRGRFNESSRPGSAGSFG